MSPAIGGAGQNYFCRVPPPPLKNECFLTSKFAVVEYRIF